MNIATLNTGIRAAVSGISGNLNTWAQGVYGANSTFIERLDFKNLPGGSECPCVAVAPFSKNMSHLSQEHFNGFVLFNMVSDTSANYLTNLETYRILCQDAIEAYARSLNLWLIIEVEYNTAHSYPLVSARTTIQLKEKQMLTGQTPLK